MIEAKETLTGGLTSKQTLSGNTNVSTIKIQPEIEDITITPTKEQQTFKHENSDAYDKVTVNPIPEEYIVPEGTLDITANGSYQVTNYESANVNITFTPNLQDKSITITENGTQNITADSGYDGLSSVEVVTEVAGSGGDDEMPTVSLFTELSKEISKLTANYMQRCVKHHIPLKNEGVTLYRPNSECMNYIIYKNSAKGSSYDIVWTQDGIPAYSYEGHINVYYFTVINKVYGCTVEPGNTNYNYYYPVTYKSDNSYSSVEECINAMKDSSTTYSSLSNLGSISCYNIEATSLVYLSSGVPQVMNRISKNETIEVIS